MAVKFYNPGSRLYEKMNFDHPTNDIKKVNLIAYYQIDAPEKSFFEVPTEVEVETESGPINVSVKFADRLQRDYKEYGLVRVDPGYKKPIGEDENIARNEKDAKERGDRLWRDYLVLKAREHIQNVDQCNASGVVPMRAKGVYAHALKTLGMEDPADKVGSAVNRTQDSDRVQALEAQIAELRNLITKGR
jgi:hypothetical protein